MKTAAVRSPSPFAITPPARLGPAPRAALRLAAPLVERLLALDRCADIYATIPSDLAGPAFFERVLDALGVSVEAAASELGRIPATGPVVVVANHPFGAIEGIVLASLLQRVRPDVRIMGNHLLGRIPQLAETLIPVDPFGGPGAPRRNVRPQREAIRWVKGGGLLVVFPAGEVSNLDLQRREIADPPWNEGVAQIVRRGGATVLPVFFDGANRPLFHLAGLLHPRLRTALLPHELLNKRQRRLRVRIGTPLPAARLAAFGDDADLVGYLRLRTYLLAGDDRSRRLPALGLRRRGRTEEPLLESRPLELLAAEVSGLPPEQRLLVSGDFEVWQAQAVQLPYLLLEIGRLRELTFRLAGEGTGRSLDLDPFDCAYTHLFVWNREARELVGAYRLGRADLLRERGGAAALYTHTLFDFGAPFLDRLGPALELGRSFVRPEYQRQFAPLLLLWKGIGQFLVRHPHYRTLFGPVSLSREYSDLSRRLMATSLEASRGLPELAALVRPRTPLRRQALRVAGCAPAAVRTLSRDFDSVAELVGDIDPQSGGVPVLLRHYLGLGGRLLAFNVDRAFSDVLDGLIVVDLRQTERRTLERYMGRDGAAAYLGWQAGEGPRACA
jgi:putative hemolysin